MCTYLKGVDSEYVLSFYQNKLYFEISECRSCKLIPTFACDKIVKKNQKQVLFYQACLS